MKSSRGGERSDITHKGTAELVTKPQKTEDSTVIVSLEFCTQLSYYSSVKVTGNFRPRVRVFTTSVLYPKSE